MKRIVTLLLAAGLVLGASSVSQAADVKAKGTWDFVFEWADTTFSKDNNNDNFNALQRLRTQVDFIASESLKGVLSLEIGNTHWGKASQGGALGTDGTNVEVRYSYIDWVVPNTDLKVRMGLQPYALPNFVTSGSNVLGDPVDGAGITLSYDFNDNVGASLFWMRAENNNVGSTLNNGRASDALDFLGLVVPTKFDGFKVTPWAMYGFVGRDSFDGSNSDANVIAQGMLPINAVGAAQFSNDRDGNAFWLGLTGEMTLFNPFRLAFDANYGRVDLGELKGTNFELKREGWYASALAEYKLDMVTPGIMFWYASGDDDNGNNGSERMPTIDGGFNATSYGYDGAYIMGASCMMGDSVVGTWGILAQLKDISFMEDLSHVFRVAYYTGTNDKGMVTKGFVAAPYGNLISYSGAQNGMNGTYLTEKDHAWEVNFDTEYKIYQDLTFVLELGYLRLDLDEDVWGAALVNSTNENNFKGALNLRYAF